VAQLLFSVSLFLKERISIEEIDTKSHIYAALSLYNSPLVYTQTTRTRTDIMEVLLEMMMLRCSYYSDDEKVFCTGLGSGWNCGGGGGGVVLKVTLGTGREFRVSRRSTLMLEASRSWHLQIIFFYALSFQSTSITSTTVQHRQGNWPRLRYIIIRVLWSQ